MKHWLALLGVVITLRMTDPKGHELRVGFGPLKVGAWVTAKIDHLRKGEMCIESAQQGRSCTTLEDASHPKLYRGYLLRESDLFVATIKWEDDSGHWHYEESELIKVEVVQ